nr:MAG: RNA-dependent RNA polymerase [Mitovirus sp.]
MMRHFHSSIIAFEEARYLVNDGVLMTRSEILAMEPTERTIIQWRILVDWELVKQRPFVIVNPMDQSGLLYLSQKEYLAQAKVCASTDLPFVTIVQIGTKPPQAKKPASASSASDHTQNSPPKWGSFKSRTDRETVTAWSTFVNLRSKIHLLVTKLSRSDKMVSENSSTIVQTLLLWSTYVGHYAEVKKPGRVPYMIHNYATHLGNLLRHNGQMFVVMQLKVALFALYSYVSGNPLKNTFALGTPMRLTNGLPSAWGPELRNRIRSGDLTWIRILASLLNIYRAMDAPHKGPSVATIEQPHPDFSNNEVFEEFKIFCADVLPGLLRRETGHNLEFRYKTGLGLLMSKAGANVSGPAMMGIVKDAHAWACSPVNYPKEWFKLNNDRGALQLLDNIQSEHHYGPNHWVQTKEEREVPSSIRGDNVLPVGAAKPEDILPATIWWATRSPFSNMPDPDHAELAWKAVEHLPRMDGEDPVVLGRLHAIDEPAGKVRVVAICDYWTQVALRPVHQHLFGILRGISTDATFDQSGTVETYYKMGFKPHWSFDLKSATDLIPMALYIEVMTQVLKGPGEEIEQARQRAELWAKLLTDREFLPPNLDTMERMVRYGTGQPMGALSSWGSMALVHHALVQFSHWRSLGKPRRPSWFKTYLVLGDDVDISVNHLVASEYQITCDRLAIPIGLLKSLHSLNNCFEFANRRFSPDGDISPISLKEELSSLTWNSRLEYAKRILARFGTKETEPGVAILRKATTPQQWDVLAPELTGSARRPLFSRTVQFILQNPFSCIHTLKSLTVDQLMDWISILPMDCDKEIANLRSEPHRLSTFKKVFLKELCVTVISSLKHRVAQYDPLMFGKVPISCVDVNADPAASVHEWIVARGLLFHPALSIKAKVSEDGKWLVWKLPREYPVFDIERAAPFLKSLASPIGSWAAPVAIHYVHMCIYFANEATREEIQFLLDKFIDLSFDLDLDDKTRESFSDVDMWEEALCLLGEYFKLPVIIEPRFDKPMKDWLVVEKENISPFLSHGSRDLDNMAFKAKLLRDLQENLKGPYEALGAALAQCGVFLPDVPQVTLQSPRIKIQRWRSLIEREARKFYASYFREQVSYQYARALKRSTHKAYGLMTNAISGLTVPRSHLVPSGIGGVDRTVEFWRFGVETNHPRTWSLFL